MKYALVTGATSGLGNEVAKALSKTVGLFLRVAEIKALLMNSAANMNIRLEWMLQTKKALTKHMRQFRQKPTILTP